MAVLGTGSSNRSPPMNADISIHFLRHGLKRPYHLSFGVITHFHTFYVVLENGGSVGLGEITPLPGYGHETPELVRTELQGFLAELRRGMGYAGAVRDLAGRAPMTASGLACALDTLRLGPEAWDGLAEPLPLAAFCPGDTPAEVAANATTLGSQGYSVLKLKVGRLPAVEEAALVRAACEALPRGSVRMDANQRSTPEHARELVRALEGLPVEHFEQPFAPDAWDLHADLARQSPVPVLLDESIVHLPDIRQAAACGIRAVKLKLCKHPGLGETRTMIEEARAVGMRTVFGNGVQTGLGNHLEARLAWQTGLDTALECNGFDKLADPFPGHGLTIKSGLLHDAGIDIDAPLPDAARVAADTFSSTLLEPA